MVNTFHPLKYLQSRLPGGAQRTEQLLLFIGGSFVLTNSVILSIVREGSILLSHLYAPLVWFMVLVAATMVIRRFRPDSDPFLLPIIGLLSGWGLILLDRLVPALLPRQLLWFTLGLVGLTVTALLPQDLRLLKKYRYTLLVTGLVLLFATFFWGVNPSGRGAALWLKVPVIGNVYFQPSELLKLLLVIFLASYFAERGKLLFLHGHQTARSLISYVGPLVLMWGFCLVFLIWQRDLGAATLFFMVFLAMLYLATGNGLLVVGGLLLLALSGLLAYVAFDVVKLRVDMWLNPWPEFDSRGFQIVQSLYALAAGGIFGQGVEQGYPDFIPVVHSDFAFSALIEEWGFIGGFVVISMISLLVYRGYRIASSSKESFNLFLASGISVLFTIQTLMIIGGVSKLVPLTGVTLPFLSYGGSSLVISCLMIGLLINISSRKDALNED